MNGRVLLDTNIIIALFGSEQEVQQRLRNAEEVFLASTVLGELYYGAYKSTKVERNIARIDAFAQQNTVLSCDTGTARLYGQIKNSLRSKGHPIPENDLWISALSVQHHLTLVTRDSHFNLIDNLEIERW